MMHRPTRLKITDVNPHLICILCGGYLIDATTMIECLHSYCRACIVAYLRQSRQCPICDTVVHKTRPLLNIRSDRTLQNIVYKLVPNLFKDEMKRRRDFYAKHPQASTSMQSPNAREERGEVCEDSLVIYTEDEYISLSLDYYFPQPQKDEKQKANGEGTAGKRPNGDTNGLPGDVVEKRYLRCPAPVCISHIKKFIRNKFGLSPAHRIEVVHQNGEDEPLRDDYTLMDVAYIYTWRRNGPLPLLFRVFEPFSKRRKGSESSVSSADSLPEKVLTKRLSIPLTKCQDSSSNKSTPVPPEGKDQQFQKPQARVKTTSETVKVPFKPTKTSLETPGQSSKTVSQDRNSPSQTTVAAKKSEKALPTDKPSTSSANTVTQSSPANTDCKTVKSVTSTKPVFTSSETTTSSSSAVVSTANTVSSGTVVVKSSSSKTDMASSNANICPKPNVMPPKPDKTPSTPNMTSSKADATPQVKFALSNTSLAPSKLKDVSSGEKTSIPVENKIAAIPNSSTVTPEVRNETRMGKTDKLSMDEGDTNTKKTSETKDQSPSQTATKTQDLKVETTPSKSETTPSKCETTPSKSEAAPPMSGTTPPKSNTTPEVPMSGIVSDGIVIDRPVLLQT